MGQEWDRNGIKERDRTGIGQEVGSSYIYLVVVVVRDWGCRNDYVMLEKGGREEVGGRTIQVRGRRQEEINVSVSVGQMDRWIDGQTDAEGLTAYRYILGIRITGSFSFPFFSFLPPFFFFFSFFFLFSFFPFSFLFSFLFPPLLPLFFVFYLQSSILNI